MIQLNINDQAVEVDVAPDTPLLWVLRDNLNLTGSKYACGIGQCGACTVLMNGHAVRSCATAVSDATNYDIVTIEGLSEDASHPVQLAWIEEDVPQCGYCQSGQILTAVALLNDKSNPTDEEIEAAMTNICRCGTYSKIRKAVKKVARERGEV
ncbi:MAG: (2Fe-2S)-binding protein [Gammaproteobacteria bacterium]|jgi:isoquinoline 1-oxidoreductase subunit alpha|nr:(2Fe-2S)-binding protein [Gammaproteobacteria bacterium]